MSRQAIAGAGFTLAGHVATAAIPAVLALWLAAPDNAYDEDRTWFFLYGCLLAQLLLMLVAVTVGATLTSSGPRRSAGTGVFAGWGIGLVLMPVLVTVLWHTVIHPS